MIGMSRPRSIKANFRRLEKLKVHYKLDFLTIYADLDDLGSLIFPTHYLGATKEENEKYDKYFEDYSYALQEYAILKCSAIVEYGFRNLAIFLIDTIGIDIYNSHKISKLEINLNDVDKLSDNKITKGMLISDSLSFGKPFLINIEMSKFLKLDFHKTLANLYSIYPEPDPDKEPERWDTYMDFNGLTSLFDATPYAKEFDEIFEWRNDIAHNARYKNLDSDVLNPWLLDTSLYLQYGTALVLFYGIFCTNFKDYNSLAKVDYFRRDVDDANPITIDEIKEVFELLFGVETEKLIEFIRQQQREYRKK